MTIGNRIRKIRLEKGMTQKQLAEKCGLFDSTIRKYESGRQNPKIETIEKIAKALDISAMVLLYGENVEDTIQQMANAMEILKDPISDYMRTTTIEKYDSLNATGKTKAFEYVIKLSENELYTTDDINIEMKAYSLKDDEE